jgi:hypothetical protein
MAAKKGNLNRRNKDTEIILEYLENFPNSPSKTLARKIYSEHPVLSSFESVYSKVRYYRGQQGAVHRKKLRDKQFQKELKVEFTMKEKFLPESYATKRDTFIFPSACNSVGIIGDVHIPYQDNDAIEVAFDEMEKQNIESCYCYEE